MKSFHRVPDFPRFRIRIKVWFEIEYQIVYYPYQACSQEFCCAYERLLGEMSSAAGANPKGSLGVFSAENFEKMDYLRPHFVRFEDSLLGNKPYEGEGSKDVVLETEPCKHNLQFI